MDEDHPVLLELFSLKSALNSFQDDAHSSAVKLQHNKLSTAQAVEDALNLEHQVSVLRSELSTLRSLSASTPSISSTTNQINQLSLSLRSLSEKLSSTEQILTQRTHELTSSLSQLSKSNAATNAAYELASRIRAREEDAKARERDLQLRVRLAEERARMSERAVAEYADLVRALEAKHANLTPPHSHVSSGNERGSVEKLLEEFAQEREDLHIELSRTQHELSLIQAQLVVEKQTNDAANSELAQSRVRLQTLERDDNTAAKMVSRYMKFSQKSTDALQASLEQLNARHNATLATLHDQLYSLSSQLDTSESRNARLRQALDDLGGDLLKESYGRRREVAMRIKLVHREERFLEALRRWLRRSEETLQKLDGDGDGYEYLDDMVQHAKILVDTLDNPVEVRDKGDGDVPLTAPISGSLARLITAQSIVDDLVEQMQREQARRLRVEVMLATREDVNDSVVVSQVENKSLSSSVIPPPLNPESDLVRSADPTVASQPAPEYLPSTPPPVAVDQPVADTAHGLDGAPNTPTLSLEPATPEDYLPSMPPPAVANQSVGDARDGPDSHTAGVPNIPEPTAPEPVIIVEGHDLTLAEPTIPSPLSLEASPLPAPPNVVHQSSQDAGQSDFIPLSATPGTLIENHEPSTGPLIRPPPLPQPPPPLPFVELEPPLPEHPLLQELEKARKRYEPLQRAFHDCHIALESLKSLLLSPSSASSTSKPLSVNSVTFPSERTLNPNPNPRHEILRAVVDRLDDFTEDVRVELEIRVSDEEVLGRGYEALLSVPGAITSSPSPLHFNYSDDDEGGGGGIPMKEQVEAQIRAFVDGTEEGIERAKKGFEKKLEDLEHDIGAVKRAVFLDFGHEDVEHGRNSDGLNSSSEPEGSGWTSWIRSSPSSTPAQTFGSVMTSRSGSRNAGLSASGSRRPAAVSGRNFGEDFVAELGLRIPMPRFRGSLAPSESRGYSPSSSPSPVLGAGARRSRTVSAMYMLGMGANTSGGLVLSPSGLSVREGQRRVVSAAPMVGDWSSNGVRGVGTEAEDVD